MRCGMLDARVLSSDGYVCGIDSRYGYALPMIWYNGKKGIVQGFV